MSATIKNVITKEHRVFPGTLYTTVLSAAQTNNQVFIADLECLPGSEPPRHVHTVEDEVIILKQGTVTFFVGDNVIDAKAGDTVVMPKNVPHHFKITSAYAKATLIATPGNFDEFFRQLSAPAIYREVPPVQAPTAEQIQHSVALMESFGMYIA